MNLKRIGAICGILGGVLFVIITFANMLVYPGGYSFFENYFSQLGLLEVGGQPNLLGYVLFSAACTSAAVCSIPFWLSIRLEFTSTAIVRYSGYLGTLLGLVAAPFLSALALFAADVYPYEHGMSTLIFFLCYTFAIIVYSVATLFNREYNNLYSLAGFAVPVIVFGHIFFIGTALMQKLAVYSLILWSAVQGYALLKMMEVETKE
jgi:hypothetical membrane protein